MSAKQQQPSALGTFTVGLEFPNPGDRVAVTFPIKAWFTLYRTLRTVGQEDLIQVSWLGVGIAHQLIKNQASGILAENQQQDAQAVEQFLSQYQQKASYVIDLMLTAMREQWHDEEEIVLHGTYEALRGGYMNHFDAAREAQALLGTPITATAWRLRVARWAKKKGLPPVDLPRGGNRRSAGTVEGSDDQSSVHIYNSMNV